MGIKNQREVSFQGNSSIDSMDKIRIKPNKFQGQQIDLDKNHENKLYLCTISLNY